MFAVGFGLVVCVFVYVMGYAVMYSFYEVASMLSVSRAGFRIYGYYKMAREMLFDVLLIGIGWVFLPNGSFEGVVYGYLSMVGILKYYIYRMPLRDVIRRKRYENGSGE